MAFSIWINSHLPLIWGGNDELGLAQKAWLDLGVSLQVINGLVRLCRQCQHAQTLKMCTVLLKWVLPNITVDMADVEVVERLCCKQPFHSATR